MTDPVESPVSDARPRVPIRARDTGRGSDRLFSARRTLSSLAAGSAAGVVVGLLFSWRLLPLVVWTVTVAVALTWVWWRSWPQSRCPGRW